MGGRGGATGVPLEAPPTSLIVCHPRRHFGTGWPALSPAPQAAHCDVDAEQFTQKLLVGRNLITEPFDRLIGGRKYGECCLAVIDETVKSSVCKQAGKLLQPVLRCKLLEREATTTLGLPPSRRHQGTRRQDRLAALRRLLARRHLGLRGPRARASGHYSEPRRRQGYWCAVDETVTRGGVHPRGGCENDPSLCRAVHQSHRVTYVPSTRTEPRCTVHVQRPVLLRLYAQSRHTARPRDAVSKRNHNYAHVTDVSFC